MVQITLELDYPNMESAMRNTHLSSLIESNKCIQFVHREQVEDIIQFRILEKQKEQSIYEQMNLNPDNIPAELKEAIHKTAFDWVHDNYYYLFDKKYSPQHKFQNNLKK